MTAVPLLLTQLIDKQDTVEIVRDQIAGILLAESQNQQAKARTAGKDPDGWALRVFTERSSCWGMFTASEDAEMNTATINTTPVVNVFFSKAEYDRKRSAPSVHAQADATFHVDIYGCGIASETTDGHAAGDMLAELEVQRAYRLVRNILMAAINENLQMLGVVGDRWPESFESLGQDPKQPHVENVACGRLTLSVSFLEFAPEYDGATLETIAGTVKRKESGAIYFKTTQQLGV